MSASMSVHSLIDKFSNRDSPSSSASSNNPNPNRVDENPQPNSAAGQETSQRDPTIGPEQEYRQNPLKRPLSAATTASASSYDRSKISPPAANAKITNIDQTGLLSLLGPNVTSFPYSEEAFIETIKLRAEQEKTKQDFYKVEIANKNFSIIQTALKVQIPVNLIPLMCVGNSPESPDNPQLQQLQQLKQEIQQQSRQQQHQQSSQPTQTQTQQPVGFQKSHSRSSSGGAPPRGAFQDSLNASPIPPMNYRFGAGSSSNMSSVRRPLSPAKIGAAAVANLATPTTPYRGVPTTGTGALSRRTRPLQSHQRHYSMPVESPSNRVGRSKPIDLAPAEYSQSAIAKNASLQPQSNPTNPVQLQSPLGATSTIQVKPSPAQPLHKQSKSNQPPSQESMTSFQHIIQFHHWKPEGPGQGPNIGGGNPFKQQPPQPNQHKRHKSTSENMSVDLTSPTELGPPHLPSVPNIKVERPQGTTMSAQPSLEEDEDEDAEMTIDTSAISDISNTTTGDASKLIPRDEPNESILDSANPPRISHSRQSSNVGRYPHDILSPSSR
ncbi:uncharacterized protein RJT20DRAFT_37276 [Scheffersomyces xylosifermentans]|uniref:uncharacterized protein n=1 Tax=Scheffersomyces xylosifermentans TaxID=1304137 RepID=UPI00315D1D66